LKGDERHSSEYSNHEEEEGGTVPMTTPKTKMVSFVKGTKWAFALFHKTN